MNLLIEHFILTELWLPLNGWWKKNQDYILYVEFSGRSANYFYIIYLLCSDSLQLLPRCVALSRSSLSVNDDFTTAATTESSAATAAAGPTSWRGLYARYPVHHVLSCHGIKVNKIFSWISYGALITDVVLRVCRLYKTSDNEKPNERLHSPQSQSKFWSK